YLERLERPDADRLDNLPPAVAVAGRAVARGPRATVGTLTEVVDYLRLLFARAGIILCPNCGREVRPQNSADVLNAVAQLPASARCAVAFPDRPAEGIDPEAWAAGLREEGFLRVQVGAAVVRLGEDTIPELANQPVWVLVDRLQAGAVKPERLTDSV